jgi:hypothetical protein
VVCVCLCVCVSWLLDEFVEAPPKGNGKPGQSMDDLEKSKDRHFVFLFTLSLSLSLILPTYRYSLTVRIGTSGIQVRPGLLGSLSP